MRGDSQSHALLGGICFVVPRPELRGLYPTSGAWGSLPVSAEVFATPAIRPDEKTLGVEIAGPCPGTRGPVRRVPGCAGHPDPSQSAGGAAFVDSPGGGVAPALRETRGPRPGGGTRVARARAVHGALHPV